MAEVLGSLTRRFAANRRGTCSKDLPQKLADDRGRVKGLHDLGLLVVGLEIRLLVPDGIDIVVVKGLRGSFHRHLPLPEGHRRRSGHLLTGACSGAIGTSTQNLGSAQVFGKASLRVTVGSCRPRTAAHAGACRRHLILPGLRSPGSAVITVTTCA
jgi:hypothetical protein